MIGGLLIGLLCAQAELTNDGLQNYRPTVQYKLEAELMPDRNQILGKGRIWWTNHGKAPVRALWWHLYLNPFSNDASTFMQETDGGELRGIKFERGRWGWVDLKKLTAYPSSGLGGAKTSTGADLLAAKRFEHPDDDNENDRTVLKTPLPFSVAPGQTVMVEIDFVSQLPKVFARTGYVGDFFMVAQWFPKLGVLESSIDPPRTTPSNQDWNCHQYHAHSEYFADYGAFEVAITVPKNFVVGATGRRVKTIPKKDKVTYVHRQDRVHDFAWTADPNFIEKKRTFKDSMVTAAERGDSSKLLSIRASDLKLSEVEVRLLIQPEHEMYADRYFDAVFASLKWFGLWYGAYPYPVLTVVDGPHLASGAMGMEYPTLITGGVRWPAAEEGSSPEVVTVHEFGHQYWYGLVGTNEFEESWLDEGFNTYSTGKVMDRAYGARVYAPKMLGVPMTPWFGGWKLTQLDTHRLGTLLSPTSDRVVRKAWDYRDTLSYGINSYPRSALILRQLERVISERTAARALRLYHLRYRYRHPTTEHFIRTVEEVAPKANVREFFNKTVFSEGSIDYAITKLKSKKVNTYAGRFEDGSEVSVEDAEATDEKDEERPYRTEVLIERLGEVSHSVSLEVHFANGEKARRRWSGGYRWKRFRFLTKAKALRAKLYPDGEQLLDLNRRNDSRTTVKNRAPAASFFSHALYATQTLFQLIGGLL